MSAAKGHGRKSLCERCGVLRVVRYGATTLLCRDCHLSLTPAEREEWRVPVKAKTETKIVVEYDPAPVASIMQLGAMNLGMHTGRRAS